MPCLASDYLYEVTKQSANIELLVQQTSDLKSDIICDEEEKKSQKLISKLLDEKIKSK